MRLSLYKSASNWFARSSLAFCDIHSSKQSHWEQYVIRLAEEALVLCDFSTINIDRLPLPYSMSEVTPVAIRLLFRDMNLVYHCKLAIGSETMGIVPMIKEERFVRINRRWFPSPLDLLRNDQVSDGSKYTRDSGILVCGLVWNFRENLMTKKPTHRVSLYHFLNAALEENWVQLESEVL